MSRTQLQSTVTTYRMKLLRSLLAFIYASHVLVEAMQGGKFITIKEVPYQAQLYFAGEGFETYCGAAIISEQWVLTAAHCLGKDVLKTQIRTGSSSTISKGTLTDVEKIIVHGDYDDVHGWDSDIALVKTKTPIEFNEYQQPIPLARNEPKVGDMITVTGFGGAHFNVYGASLQKSKVPVITIDECRRNLTVITERMFCTNGKDVDLCYGDSGSPGEFNGEIVGIASQGCEYGIPNVFTSIAKFYDWIIRHTGIEYEEK